MQAVPPTRAQVCRPLPRVWPHLPFKVQGIRSSPLRPPLAAPWPGQPTWSPAHAIADAHPAFGDKSDAGMLGTADGAFASHIAIPVCLSLQIWHWQSAQVERVANRGGAREQSWSRARCRPECQRRQPRRWSAHAAHADQLARRGFPTPAGGPAPSSLIRQLEQPAHLTARGQRKQHL